MAGRSLPVGAVLLVGTLAALSCTTAPLPTASPEATSTPTATATPTAEPSPSPMPGIACGPQVQIVDSTGRMSACHDLGGVDATSVAPHLAIHGIDLSALRVWWSTTQCVSGWDLDLHSTPYGFTLAITDRPTNGCPVRLGGQAIDLELHPMIQPEDTVLLHNGVPVVLMPRPANPTPPPFTYPGTPASIHFGRWELAPGENPSRDSTEIHVLVFDRACASGQSREGRVLDPFIAYEHGYIWIAFGVWSLAGSQTCVAGSGAPFTVELRERLGNRELRGWNTTDRALGT